MKTFLALMFVMLTALPVGAQNPVLLEEWFSISGGNYGLSYLPDFAVNHGGINASTVSFKGKPTWYNRFQGDTVNQFEWDYVSSILSVDFNNDGIKDYITSGGRIYQGKQAGEPPERTTIVISGGLNYRSSFVSDFNGDGYDDILTSAQDEPGSAISFAVLILGNADIEKVQSLHLSKPIGKKDYLIGAYTTPNGKPRVVLYTDDFGTEGFYLVEFTVSFPGGTPEVSFTTLHKFERERPLGVTQPYFDPLYTAFYESKKYNEHSMVVSKIDGSRPLVYSLDEDTLRLATENYYAPQQCSALSGSVDGDDKEDFIIGGVWNKSGDLILGFYLTSGNPAKEPLIRRGFFPREDCGGNILFRYIGDVSGDGIGDFGYVSRNGCLHFYKGLNWQAVGVQEAGSTPDFTLGQNEPNPVGKDGKTVVPITLMREGRYTLTLYNGEGKRIAELFGGILPAGEARLPIDLMGMALGSGFYTLRLSDGKATRERGILITK